ncbi:MAG: hypothetical protein K2H74_02910 [Paramuribaculum sp.]|nr:hypothetical protein [Paramuribaculum sp.]
MGIRSNWLSAPRRLWRRRGHGVHSPFAYDFLRRVIAQPCHFYAYPRLDRIAAEHSLRPHLARLLYRLCLHVAPLPVSCSGTEAEALAAIVADLLPAGCPRPVAASPAPEGIAFATADAIPALIEAWDAMPAGMLFRGTSAAIITGYPHLYHQRFDIWI